MLPIALQAVKAIARHGDGGLRFHNLRHSYASWLITSGVPVPDMQRVMGHERATTTLAIYTHVQGDSQERILDALAAFSLLTRPEVDRTGTRLVPGSRSDLQFLAVDLWVADCDTNAQVRDLERLVKRLPKPTSTSERATAPRKRPGTAKQLTAEQTARLTAGYQEGAEAP
ncbi:tyrosine-type recombinase/integrase [Kribbella qitaiheensis]|uniref:tyrosine-type recombinase/integrase n=1 Tax=Kribbella qitaiheensis TaxID=1544730 RepID=UPI002483AA34|nr:tyrosine-type recombinase/integrase [Kribbella qitaiheensis]